jgi:putative flippase GtrA
VVVLEIGEGPAPQSGIKKKITDLDKKYHVFKLAKFAIASGLGFLLAEGILTLGVLGLYGKFTAPGSAYSSPTFLSIDVAALALGVALSFFLNERFTVKVHKDHKHGGFHSRPARLLKFEGVNALGNLAIIVVQFALLLTLSVTPVIGNVVGAIVSYPITYLISMHFVWKPVSGVHTDKGLTRHRHQPAKKVGPSPSPIAPMVFLVSLYAIGKILQRRKRQHARTAHVYGRPGLRIGSVSGPSDDLGGNSGGMEESTMKRTKRTVRAPI